MAEVYELVRREIMKMNQDFATVARVKKFVNLYKEFDPDDDELTRNSKIAKNLCGRSIQRYRGGLYSDAQTIHMDTNITYEDGRVSHIKADLKSDEVPQ